MSESKGMPRTAVVTGGNSGVGLAVAEALGKKGYTVWIAGRNAEKGANAVARLRPHCPAGVAFLQLDVMLFSSIEQFVRTLRPQLGGRLDALVHSMGIVSTKRKVSADGLEENWATQFLGRYLLTEALTPELSTSEDGRVVFVSANAPKKPQLFEDDPSLEKNFSTMRAIAQNQSACVLYQQMYADEHPSGPAINSAVAGLVRNTGITRAQSGLTRAIFGVMFRLFGITPAQSATNIVALASDPALKDISGSFFSKPQDLEKRQKLAYDETHVASLRRLLGRYAGVRNTLLSV
ncbi:oxidoreductase [Ktedonobacter sp. SOSP1-85]|uniref:SDR family NAD(P)-dependent oxidoreductase n=1 Tax=Ktedonobacter sp. SOSP1-85 TaxID=2778367 RepID=UPI001914F18B|nr:SDR family NAD(P)-dependent oxidoreductase [Ktedonobacter sp. SOSP1-85]GHO77216.1 oxidoreductase [Ktedonobacter sp. SOSP1-85]